MFFNGFPSFSANKSAARPCPQARSQPKPAHTAHTAPTPSKKPSRLQTVVRALRLPRSQLKVEEQYHHPRASQVPPGALQPPCPATYEGPTLSTSARPSAAPTLPSFPNSTFSIPGPTRLTIPRSAATTPATIYSNLSAAFTPNSPLPATLPATDLATNSAEAIKRIAHLEFTISQLERDNAHVLAFARERDAEKTARKVTEDRLAEEIIASHAKTEKMILKERKQYRQAERARVEVCHALETKNAELQAALLDLQTTTDFLDFEVLQASLVRLGIAHPDDQQYPQAVCIAPFLNSVCAAAK
ncbi:hypothetical protein FRC04_008546 [Tulasnella sp. 424]|nr:hypothetical protein FRC04_008546 [Tulasnella sp. 424]